VLFFRDQDIDRDQQRRFAEKWGELEQHPFFKFMQPGQTDVDVVTLAKDAANAGIENEWHTDITWSATPSFGAVLRALEVPAIGGDTLWADAGAAYDGLSDELKERIDPLMAVHDWRASFGEVMREEIVAALAPKFPAIEHPVVRVHPEKDGARSSSTRSSLSTSSVSTLPRAPSCSHCFTVRSPVLNINAGSTGLPERSRSGTTERRSK
jgi:taurine dioxygenase